MPWQIDSTAHLGEGGLCAFEHEGIPVLVRRDASRAEATDGVVSTATAAHVCIELFSVVPPYSVGPRRYTGVLVTSVGDKQATGLRSTREILRHRDDPSKGQATYFPWMNSGKLVLYKAIPTVRAIQREDATVARRSELALMLQPADDKKPADRHSALGHDALLTELAVVTAYNNGGRKAQDQLAMGRVAGEKPFAAGPAARHLMSSVMSYAAHRPGCLADSGLGGHTVQWACSCGLHKIIAQIKKLQRREDAT